MLMNSPGSTGYREYIEEIMDEGIVRKEIILRQENIDIS